MKVIVKFFTTLREITDKKEVNMAFSDDEPITINTILKRLAKRYGNKFVAYVYNAKTGDVKAFLQFLVNGRSVSDSEGLNTILSDGDVLAIIPPVGGG